MSYNLYREYRFAGRGTGRAVIIPIREGDDELRVIYKSVSAQIKYMNTENVRDLVSNSLIDEDTRKSLVEQSNLGQDLCLELEKKLEENGGSMGREKWQEELREAEKVVSE